MFADTLWALKTSPSQLTRGDALHVLVHYLAGRHCCPEIAAVRNLGAYNPRLDAAYAMPFAEVPSKTAQSVERDYVEAILSGKRVIAPSAPSPAY